MMSSPGKSKKSRAKPPRGRPESTSTLSQPVVEDTSHLTTLSSFSPNGNLFAFLSLAVDKHRLRIYDTVSGQSAAEYVVDSARVTALTWSNIAPAEAPWSSLEDSTTSPSKKKRKKRNSQVAEEGTQTKAIEAVVLGLSDGTVLFFSPTHGRIIRTLSHATSTAAILCVVINQDGHNDPTIWTSSADGVVRLWHARNNDILHSWKNDDRTPYSSMAVRPGLSTDQEGQVDMLVANHSIRLLSTTSNISQVSDLDTQKPKQLASFTGHASPIQNLQWDASQEPTNRFLTMAEADRFLYIWEVPEIQSGSSTEGKIVASVPLDSDARTFSLSTSLTSGSEKQTLLTLAASGKVSVFPIPTELVPPASSNRTQHRVPTLLSRSNLSVSSKNASSAVQVVDVSFVPGDEGHLRIARIVGGVRPVFDLVRYLDDTGDFIQDVVIDDVKTSLIIETQLGAPNKRYAESSSLAVRSGVEIGQDQEMDGATRNVDGDLDVDLAELSLGQRLTALSGADDALGHTTPSDSDDEAAPKRPKKSSNKKTQNDVNVVPANSLTRTLIQALHSSDSRLLETCLAHSDQTLIRNTVQRLPPQLAVALITACVERLGRGARAGSMKGGGGGASSQRGTGLITWVKTVLAVHSGHLMTMPDLVARLSGLHATLTSRLTLQESLLTLNGRLDMVLSQIEMRSSAAPAPLAPQKGNKPSNVQGKEVRQYVEGESEDDDEQMDVEVEDDRDETGSIEDVELGGTSEDDEDDEDEEEEESEEDDESDGQEPTMNGFIDDEAEEDDEEDDDDSE